MPVTCVRVLAYVCTVIDRSNIISVILAHSVTNTNVYYTNAAIHRHSVSLKEKTGQN